MPTAVKKGPVEKRCRHDREEGQGPVKDSFANTRPSLDSGDIGGGRGSSGDEEPHHARQVENPDQRCDDRADTKGKNLFRRDKRQRVENVVGILEAAQP